jgi:hypothetical protein
MTGMNCRAEGREKEKQERATRKRLNGGEGDKSGWKQVCINSWTRSAVRIQGAGRKYRSRCR